VLLRLQPFCLFTVFKQFNLALALCKHLASGEVDIPQLRFHVLMTLIIESTRRYDMQSPAALASLSCPLRGRTVYASAEQSWLTSPLSNNSRITSSQALGSPLHRTRSFTSTCPRTIFTFLVLISMPDLTVYRAIQIV